MKSIYRNYLKTGGIVWALCFAGLFLFYLVVLGPQERLRSQTQARLSDVAARAQAASDAAQEKNKLRLTQQVQEAVATLGRFAVAQGSTDNLTLDIGEIPGREGLSAFGISGGGEGVIKMPNCKQITGRRVTVSFASSFNRFAAFLNALERFEPVIIIDTFSITRSREEATPHKVEMALAVLVDETSRAQGGG